MTDYKVNFKFSIKSDIKIKKLNVSGFIIGLYFGETGRQYQISYFINGEKKSTYFYEEEIESTDGTEKFGFTS